MYNLQTDDVAGWRSRHVSVRLEKNLGHLPVWYGIFQLFWLLVWCIKCIVSILYFLKVPNVMIQTQMYFPEMVIFTRDGLNLQWREEWAIIVSAWEDHGLNRKTKKTNQPSKKLLKLHFPHAHTHTRRLGGNICNISIRVCKKLPV